MGLRTLAEVPSATIIDLGRLFSDEPYRRSAVARLRDPLMRGAWQSFEALSEAEKAQHVQAPLARIMALGGRPSVRAVIAQPEPRLDIARLLDGRGWLLVSLAPGALGEPAAALLGSVLMYSVWNAIEARATLPQAKRHPLFLYVDELASVAHLPFGFELLAERARGLGAGVTVAAQTLSRLPAPTRDALLGNVGTFVSFRAAQREAGHIARELAGMSPEDMQSLGKYEVAARVSTGAGSAITTMTGTTLPMPPVTGQAKRIRELSAERYGVDPGDTYQQDHEFGDASDGADVGRSRRRS